MNIQSEWPIIRKHIRKCTLKNLYVSIATVDAENRPTVTPIGSLFLDKETQTGYYFEKLTVALPKAAKHNKQICVLAVNNSLWFWFKSLYRVKFKSYPGIKLYGELGERRLATDKELAKFKRQTKPFSAFKGHDYLWGDMKHVREIRFTKASTINLAKMTKHL